MGCNESKPDLELQGAKTLLNESYDLNGLQLQNRFVMGPMTRCRGDAQTGVPSDLMAEYYEQRAGFGLILTECSQVSPLSNAFPGSGGIYNKEQMEGWKKVVDRVHAKGGKIVIQLWHCGRAVPSEFIGGQTPIAPSPIPINQDHHVTKKPHPVPKEMTQQDIIEVIGQFKKAAELAKEAGFDGVQLHGANGYLIDQFLRDDSNKRKDQYGGDVKGRSKFLLDIIDEVSKVYPSNRVSVRLTPTGRFGDMYDSNPIELIEYLLGELSKKDLHFVEVKRHGGWDDAQGKDGSTKDEHGRILPSIQIPDFYKTIRGFYKGTLMANQSFNPKSAEEAIMANECDIVSFSSLSISNPDLPERHQNNWEFAEDDRATHYMGGAKGYTDYPIYSEQKKE